MNNSYKLINIDVFEKQILSFGKIPKIIELLWEYNFSSYGDSATLHCEGYFENENNSLEKKYIGYVTYIPNNFNDYYEKVNDLAFEMGNFAKEKYNSEIYFPSQGKIEFDFPSYEELYLTNQKLLSENDKDDIINSTDTTKTISEKSIENVSQNNKKYAFFQKVKKWLTK